MPDQRLRKLELTGFKTFARRTELLLPGGLTGIVGPNGSGKSNLADALRWALGEQSLQHIRSKKTEDVIFAGGANRSPLGMAEVTLTLDNTSGWIPLDFSEVTLTRRAYRSGDNEYFINNARVRLRDIVDLRSRAGFGQSSYSVIGQGLVDSVLSQRPEERRALFEEAAGIRHYQAKRDQTLDQLAATQQNLLRAQDILAEIEPRLDTLRRQSERTRQHAQLSEELRTLQIRWYASRKVQLQRQLTEAETLAGDAKRALEEAAEASLRLENQAATLEAEKLAAEQRLAAQNRETTELQRRREQLQGQIGLAQDKLEFLRQQSADADREVGELTAAEAALREQLSQIETELAEMRQAEAALGKEIEQAEAKARVQADQMREAEQHLQGTRDALTQAQSARQQRERELAELGDRQRDLERQTQQHMEDLHRKQGLAKVLGEKQAALQAELAQMRGGEERLSGQIEEARMSVTTAGTALTAKDDELAELRSVHAELATRLALLQELQTNLEGLGEGTQALLKQNQPGVLGSVADGLKVEPGYERAIAAALGHKLDAVLVEGERRATAVLAAGEVSEATLMVASTATPEARTASLPEGARQAVSVLEQPSSSIQRLLAGTIVVDELENAFEAKRNGWRSVTIAGDVVDLDGTITRRSTSAGEAVVKRQRAIEELSERMQTSEAVLQAAEAERQRLAEQVAETQRKLAELEGEGKERAAQRQHKSSELRDFVQQLDTARAQVDWLAALKGQVEQQIQTIDLRRTGLSAELDQNSADIDELKEAAKAAETAFSALQESGQSGAEHTGELRLQLGILRQRAQHVETQRIDIQAQVGSAERQRAARQRRVDEQAGVVHQLQAEIDAAQAELLGVQSQLESHERDLPPLHERVAGLVDQARTLRQQESAIHEEQSELDKRCYRLNFDQQRKGEEIDSLASSLMEDLQLTIDLLPQPQADVPEPSKREVDSLKARLAGLGPINPEALDEFQEVAQRHEFLTTQKADLEGAAQQLRTVIAELEELTQRQFLETFERIGSEFERYFNLMFEGGQVQMFLTEPESVHQTGIEILAQPPGKRLQALPLLSGGERALVASALLFAILSVRPVPFCLLDEVDAALDEANVKRFCQALKSLAEQTQFIVITHNRETMAVADALYGVSMSQDGVSRLVSLRLPREDSWAEEETPDGAEQAVSLAS